MSNASVDRSSHAFYASERELAGQSWSTPRLRLHWIGEAGDGDVVALMADARVRPWLDPARVRTDARPTWQSDIARVAARCIVDGRLVGMCGFTGRHLSYAVVPEVWGRGFGGEIVQAACGWIAPRLGLSLVQAAVERANVRSRRLLESAGFAWQGSWVPDAPPFITVLEYSRRLDASGDR